MHPNGVVGWIIRALQLFFDIIVLSMAAALVANQPSGGSPSQVNYSVFVGVFTILSWLYTAAASTVNPEGLGSPVIIIILDSLNALFTFAGGVALAVALRVHSCGNVAYIMTNGIIAGSTQRCHEAQTLTAFLWFGNNPHHPGIGLELTSAIAFGAYLASIIAIALFSSVEVRRIRKGGGGVSQMTSLGV